MKSYNCKIHAHLNAVSCNQFNLHWETISLQISFYNKNSYYFWQLFDSSSQGKTWLISIFERKFHREEADAASCLLWQ